MAADRPIADVFRYLLPIAAAAAVAITIYEVGRGITPDYSGTALFGSTATDTLPIKAWLATGVLAIAGFQLLAALWIYGRLPLTSGFAPKPVRTAHRVAGVLAFLLTLPIAYHCMLAYGAQTFDTRIAVHSLAGCFFYGAFAAKLIVVRSRRLPGWALPLAGGVLITVVAVLWYTSALWYFNGYSVPLVK
jgi:hypothetical protein